MDLNAYQQKSSETNITPRNIMLEYLALGLCSEAGEVAGKIKKFLRGDGALDKAGVAYELGDVLWYLSELAKEIGFDLSTIAGMNLDKLANRAKNNTLHGEGDYR